MAALVAPGDKVFLLGDSEAFLLNPELAALAKADGVTFASHVEPGSSVISWSREHDKGWAAMRRFAPSVALVSLGANDGCMGTRIVANEVPYLNRFFVRSSRARVRTVVWLGAPKIGAPEGCGRKDCLSRAIPGLEAFAQMVRPYALYLDAREINVTMWDDLLHPDVPGRKVWAAWVWNKLREP